MIVLYRVPRQDYSRRLYVILADISVNHIFDGCVPRSPKQSEI